MFKTNLLQIILGIIVLFIGILVYLLDRPMNSVYFLAKLQITYYTQSHIFGSMGNNLPSFIHTFSFCLITAGILACQKRRCYFSIALSWFLFNTFFELLQKYDKIILSLPKWLETIPFLENTKNYFLKGTFDIFDVLSIAIGAVVGFVALLAIDRFAITNYTGGKND